MLEKIKRILRSKTAISFIACFLSLCLINRNITDSVFWLAIDTLVYIFIWFLGERTREAQWQNDLFIAILLDFSAITLMTIVIIKNFLLFMEGKIHGAEIELTWLVIVFHCFCAILPAFSDGLDRYYEIKDKKNQPQMGGGTYRPIVPPMPYTQEEDDITPVLAIADGTCTFLAQKGLERFLIKDYIESGFFFSDWALSNKEETQNKLYIELRDMLSFLELPPCVRVVVEYNSDNSEQAGSYQKSSYGRIITVNIRPFYSKYHVFAILCHECAHYFMEYHNLNWNDTELNEQKTDVIANLIGFNKVMLKGYREIVTHKDYRTKTTHKIGYITDQDCIDLSNFIKHRRKKIMKSNTMKNLMRDVEKHFEVAKTLARQLDFIDLKKLDAETPERFTEIQKVIMEIETYNISAEIRKYEKILAKKLDLAQLLKTKEAIDLLCTNLVSWQAILQKNTHI